MLPTSQTVLFKNVHVNNKVHVRKISNSKWPLQKVNILWESQVCRNTKWGKYTSLIVISKKKPQWDYIANTVDYI